VRGLVLVLALHLTNINWAKSLLLPLRPEVVAATCLVACIAALVPRAHAGKVQPQGVCSEGGWSEGDGPVHAPGLDTQPGRHQDARDEAG
jgi:hypothetical protein